MKKFKHFLVGFIIALLAMNTVCWGINWLIYEPFHVFSFLRFNIELWGLGFDRMSRALAIVLLFLIWMIPIGVGIDFAKKD